MPQTVVFSKTISLTNAQFKALPGTPVELIPAPGVGKVNNIVNLVFHFNTNAGAYTQSDDSPLTQGTLMNVRYAGYTNDIIERLRADFSFGAVQDIVYFMGSGITNNGLSTDVVENLPINLSISGEEGDGSINLGGGNVANVCKITVNYSVIVL